jgi:Zn-dependent peptidase ImmA (M78 family)
MFSEIPDDEFAAAIDACAADVLWEAGVIQPPIDALAVAEALGMAITRDDAMPHRGRFVRLAEWQRGPSDRVATGQDTIVVGVAERPERAQWAVAHEIGECVAYRVFDRLGVSFDEALPTAREMVANRLATSMLLPRRGFTSDGRDLDWDLLALKERYSTASHELIARRMLEIRPPIVITVCDLGRVHWRRSNVSANPPGILAEEKEVWHASHVTGLYQEETLDAECGIVSVRCWPIHEPDWKREIIRSEIAEW